jgi:hypothetical protein
VKDFILDGPLRRVVFDRVVLFGGELCWRAFEFRVLTVDAGRGFAYHAAIPLSWNEIRQRAIAFSKDR